MTENEVNIKCKEWILSHGFHYKGVLNTMPEGKKVLVNKPHPIKYQAFGDVPIPLPNGERQVLIDHQGFSDKAKELVWIEAKGGGGGLSQLLEGFIRVCLAVYYGGGIGYLAVPHAEYEQLLEIDDFLKTVIFNTNGENSVAIFDVEKDGQSG